MKAEDAIKTAKSDSRLRQLATNKSRTLEEANELADLLLIFTAQLQTSVLDIRDKMATQEGAIEMLANMIAPEDASKAGLVGFDEPKIVGIERKPN